MNANRIAHPQGVDTDFLTGALTVLVTAHQRDRVGTGVLNGPGQHQRRAAGNVHLLIVVGFHNLNVGVGEHPDGCLDQFGQDGDAKRHVA